MRVCCLPFEARLEENTPATLLLLTRFYAGQLEKRQLQDLILLLRTTLYTLHATS